MQEAVDNLVKNAFDHTKSGDTIHVEWNALPSMVQIHHFSNIFVFLLQDDRTGIQPGDFEQILHQRFDAVVQDIARQYHYRAKQEQKKLVLSGSETVTLWCDRDWMQDVVAHFDLNHGRQCIPLYMNRISALCVVKGILYKIVLDAGSVVLEKKNENVAEMVQDIARQYHYRAKQEQKKLVRVRLRDGYTLVRP